MAAQTVKNFVILIICILMSYFVFLFSSSPRFAVNGCGLRSLLSVLQVLGYSNIHLGNILSAKKDLSFSEIEKAVHELGMNANLCKTTIRKLRDDNSVGILHIDGHHFVGLVGYDSQTIHIAETGYEGPPRIERWSDGDLMARWDGVILVISKPKDGTIPAVAAQKATQAPTATRLGNYPYVNRPY